MEEDIYIPLDISNTRIQFFYEIIEQISELFLKDYSNNIEQKID